MAQFRKRHAHDCRALTRFWLQAWTLDSGAAQGFSSSNALLGTQ